MIRHRNGRLTNLYKAITNQYVTLPIIRKENNNIRVISNNKIEQSQYEEITNRIASKQFISLSSTIKATDRNFKFIKPLKSMSPSMHNEIDPNDSSNDYYFQQDTKKEGSSEISINQSNTKLSPHYSPLKRSRIIPANNRKYEQKTLDSDYSKYNSNSWL